MTREDFKSDEEWYFYHWLKEAEEYNLVSLIEYQPESIQLCSKASIGYEKELKTKTKIMEKFLFDPHKYTPDFAFTVIHEWLDKYFINTSYLAKNRVLVDIKGTFNKYSDAKQFSINQKWCYDKFDIYIEKIVPEKFFKESWCPEECRLTPKQKKPVKKYVGVPVIKDFIEGVR